MNSTIVGKGNAAVKHDMPNAEFIFTSDRGGIRGTGVFEQIQLPVVQRYAGIFGEPAQTAGSQPPEDERFHRAISDAMKRAQACGIINPVIIGAIPFDTAQPAFLTIPRRYEVFSRELDRPLPAPTSGALAVAQGQTSGPAIRRWHSQPQQPRFEQAVQQAIANFQLSDIRKTVLSRMLELELDAPLDLDAFFARLVEQNPSGFHFRLPLAEGAELIGASPELLVRRQGDGVFSNPLAGSARRQGDADVDRELSERLLRSTKDAYEHQLVIDDIRERLMPLCDELHIPAAPSLMATPTMWHLSTPIHGRLGGSPLTALQIACRLHPTPAVCGFPTRQARKLIQLVEPFDRGMFTGMVGWCDAQGNGEWAVTIRCGVFSGQRVQLFAGAGIVEDSDPRSEWLETEAKLQTMLKALGVDLPVEPEKHTAPRANAPADACALGRAAEVEA